MFYLDVPFMCIYALVSIINNTIQYKIHLFTKILDFTDHTPNPGTPKHNLNIPYHVTI